MALAAGGLLAAAAIAVVFWPSGENAKPSVTGGDTVGRATSDEVILVDRPFRCTRKVDLDLVRVTMRKAVDDAISIEEGCTGRIGRVEVETWTADGISVQNHGRVAHDLVIESGYIKCHAFAGGAHQDGIQVMGGRELTFRGLRVDCLGNANFFVAEGGSRASTPTEIVCEECVLGPNSAQTLFNAASIRSGARGTTICTGRFRAIRVEPDVRQIVDDGNAVLPHDDPSCVDVTGQSRAG